MNYESRRQKVFEWMGSNRVDVALFRSDSDVRYLSGMPTDSLLLLFADGRSVLSPWDALLADARAEIDEVVPFTSFQRDAKRALREMLADRGIGAGDRVETAYDVGSLDYDELKTACAGADLVCRRDGLGDHIRELRSKKDADEIASIERAAQITNVLLGELERSVESGELETEIDVAFFLERGARRLGAEALGFATLVASSGRSNQIHPYPGFTAAPLGKRGSAIVDFGVVVDGYTSDVTTTFLFGELTRTEEELVSLVEQAHEEAIARCVPGADARELARHVDALFESHGFEMPHGLGHGIGLEVHEAPHFKSASEDQLPIEAGMVFTIEPGLYTPRSGGVRLENDVLADGEGARVITESRIIRFPDPLPRRRSIP